MAMDRRSVNSLFIAWLTEWRKEAAEKDSKVQYIYTKALKSIKKYPLTLTSGIECKILEGFGDKLCSQIEERLNKEIRESGTSLSAEEFVKSFDSAKLQKQPKAKFTKIKNKASSVPNEGQNALSAKDQSIPSGVGGLRPYVPSKRSGAYALLLTLANHFRKHHQFVGDGKMEKKELMEDAQPLTDASFKIPPAGSHYTAWSSMGTLVKKGLVKREGCPAMYSITTEGLKVADELEATGDDNNFVSRIISESVANDNNSDDDVIFVSEPEDPKIFEKPVQTSRSRSSTSATVSKADANEQQNMAAKPYWFVYIQEDGKSTQMKDRAGVKVDERTCEVKFLIRCKYEDLLLSGKNYSMDYSRSCAEAGSVYAFLSDNDAPDVVVSATSVPSVVQTSDDLQKRKEADALVGHTSLHSSTSSSSSALPTAQKKMSAKSKSTEPAPSNKRQSSNGDDPPELVKKKPKLSKSSSEEVSLASKNSAGKNPRMQGSGLIEALKNVAVSDSPAIPTESRTETSEFPKVSPEEADAVLVPGSFEVVLLVDNRESLGPAARSSSEEMLHKELRKNSVTFEVRQLQLGDFAWVARGAAVELVLDYIVERKRMDDLASSIVDGRFREQKFRLSNCGLSNVAYLVEENGRSSQHLSIPEASLEQAIVNTQVVDEFIVKRVKSAKELTNYLVLMTRYLQSQYEKKTLYGFKRFFRLNDSRSSASPSDIICLMTYDSFSEHSLKSKCLTVSEMFLKQLTQINGVTAEKACTIVQKYPTPLILYEAYKNCAGEDERNKMLADIKCGPLKRNLGPALSKTIANLYS